MEEFKEITFDVNREIRTIYQIAQYDESTRGFIVTYQSDGVDKEITTEKLVFQGLKADGKKIIQEAEVIDGKFVVSLPRQAATMPGVMLAQLTLLGEMGERLSDKKFKIVVDRDVFGEGLISEDERGILDRAFDFAQDIMPRIEALDIEALEGGMENINTLIPEVERLIVDVETATENANLKIDEMDRVTTENTTATEEAIQVLENYVTQVEQDITDVLQRTQAVTQEAETATENVIDKIGDIEALESDINQTESERVQAEADRVQAEGIRASFYDDYNTQLSEIKGALKHIKLESWADVQKAVRDGSHKNIVSVGDSFVATYAGVEYLWDVIGIDHDTPVDPRFTHSMTIQSRDCLMNCVFDAPEPTNPDANIKLYGNNNYKNSNIRQWLNSTDEVFNFAKQHTYDEVPTSSPYTGAGFLHNLDPELREVIGPVKKQVAKNSVTDGGGQDTFEDTVFLLSRVEAYGGTEGDYTGEKPYEYYSVLAPSATPEELSGRIKYLSGASRVWWLRSPYVGTSYYPRFVHTTGSISYRNANYAYGLAPACTIY